MPNADTYGVWVAYHPRAIKGKCMAGDIAAVKIGMYAVWEHQGTKVDLDKKMRNAIPGYIHVDGGDYAVYGGHPWTGKSEKHFCFMFIECVDEYEAFAVWERLYARDEQWQLREWRIKPEIEKISNKHVPRNWDRKVELRPSELPVCTVDEFFALTVVRATDSLPNIEMLKFQIEGRAMQVRSRVFNTPPNAAMRTGAPR